MSQVVAAFALIRALRMELHSSQHLCGVLLRELYRPELQYSDHRPDKPVHASSKQRLASVQDTLLNQQKRLVFSAICMP